MSINIHIITIGKWKKAGEERALYENYVKRSPWNINLHELAPLPKLPDELRRAKETQAMLEYAKGQICEHMFALDERGKNHSSIEFAAQLKQMVEQSTRNIGFLIGGDVGLDINSLPSNTNIFSFGRMVWPHLLVRVMLAEQVYRAQTIITNHPYHRT